ncbi:hypothetical protein CLF_111784 [Clonorchis sinensis]|uniref:Uncharacterized protein n=1 Tax=Clonorchis sinensis TaxID=79923 RepID=G7YLZ6_CLOSI|nr:hypothetical protein CLF_111784 [Clonorchis sinensis]
MLPDGFVCTKTAQHYVVAEQSFGSPHLRCCLIFDGLPIGVLSTHHDLGQPEHPTRRCEIPVFDEGIRDQPPHCHASVTRNVHSPYLLSKPDALKGLSKDVSCVATTLTTSKNVDIRILLSVDKAMTSVFNTDATLPSVPGQHEHSAQTLTPSCLEAINRTPGIGSPGSCDSQLVLNNRFPTSPIRPQDHWISARSLSMIDARKSIPAGNEYDGARKSLKRQIVKSLRKDRELW